MNLLFYTNYYPSETSGGVEHVTYLLRESLSKIGYSVYILYSISEQIVNDSNAYILPEKDKDIYIEELCSRIKVSTVIIQGDISKVGLFSALRESARIKLIYVHHGDPAYGYATTRLDTYFLYLFYGNHDDKIKYLIRILLYPVIKTIRYWSLRRSYKNLCSNVDKVIVLSSKFIKSFMDFSGTKDSAMFDFVNNPLSYTYGDTYLQEKEKIVLIVARMEEFTKKISWALKTWKIIMSNEQYSDWNLKIVGNGQDIQLYKNYVDKNEIRNVEFCGYNNPLAYYRRASILLMTSISEGWGLTLTEAMQNGCVPIAFNTYSSITDILINDFNGILVNDLNTRSYANAIMDIMDNNQKRLNLALNGFDYVSKFSIENVINKWVSLLTTL